MNGISTLIDAASDSRVCPVRVIKKMIEHPGYIRMRELYLRQHPEGIAKPALAPLFLADKGVIEPPSALAANTISKILKDLLAQAGVSKDPSGRVVHPKYVRRTQNIRAQNAHLPKILRQKRGAWATPEIVDRYYSADGCPLGSTDFYLHISENPGITKTMTLQQQQDNWLDLTKAAALPVLD